MRTARLPTVRVSVAKEGWVSPVYKFEQVTSDDHQMSIAGGGGRFHFCYLGEGEEEIYIWYLGWWGGLPMSQCIMGTGHMGTPWTEWQTDICENITFPQLPWKVVIIWYRVISISTATYLLPVHQPWISQTCSRLSAPPLLRNDRAPSVQRKHRGSDLWCNSIITL